MDRNRQYVLGALLVIFAILAGIVLGAVLQTVVFAITVAYVLYPFKQWLGRRGLSNRIASGLATGSAFLAVGLVFGPLFFVLYQRRDQFIETLRGIPETISTSVAGFELTVETEPFVDTAVRTLQDLAVSLAVAAPALSLQIVLFTLLLYGLLYRPRSPRVAILRLVPDQYHDILWRLHDRTRTTLFALYVLQASTAFATFLIALVLFWLFGYSSPLAFAAIAGILQFIPILGPSILIFALVLNDFLIGMPGRGVAMLVTGLLLISLMPDAVVRTKLAGATGKIAPSLYFVGFVGGILTIGALGVVVGPLVVALLVEVVALLSDRAVEPAVTATGE